MKKILSAILASSMILSSMGMVSAQEYAQTTPETQNTEVLQPIETQTLTSGKCGTNAYWSFDGSTGTLTISGTGAMDSRPWNSYREDIKSVVISEGITTIGDSAFYRCWSLTSVNIPNSVTELGSGAFSQCTSLTSITIPNSVTEIAWGAFDGCYSLTSITIPNSVTTIADSAFYDCDSLASINIPNSVTVIEEGAFGGCESLTSITIGNSVTTIGPVAFLGCYALTTVSIPNSVTTIGSCAFGNCTSLTSVFIPDSVKVIEELAFHTYDSRSDTLKALPDVTVYGYAGSYAETWCKTHSSNGESSPVPFVAVNSVPSWAQTTTTPSTPTYSVTTTTPSNGTVSLGQSTAEAGERVTLTVSPSSGYMIDSVLVKDASGNSINCGYDWTEGCYAFLMPSEKVTISVIFIKIPTVTYTTQLNQTTGGNFSVSTSTPQEGDEVTITTKPNSGYSVSYVTVYTTSGVRVPCINMGNGVFVYKQPSSAVIVTTTYQNVTVATEKFTDITANDWYTAYVAYVTENGLMNGTDTGVFSPDIATSRAMVALILALASGEEIPVATTQEFPDVPLGEWYTNGISWCKEKGVVSGYDNGNFGTNDAITNEQMVVMMKSFAEYQGMNTKNADSSLLLGYADCNSISFWAEDAYAWALENEFLQIEGNKLNPQDNASRAEFANILNLFLENQ